MALDQLILRGLLSFVASFAGSLLLLALPTPLFVFLLRRRFPTAAAVRARCAAQPASSYWAAKDRTVEGRLRHLWKTGLNLWCVFGVQISFIGQHLLAPLFGLPPGAAPAHVLHLEAAVIIPLAWTFLPHALARGWLARAALRRPLTHADPSAPHGQSFDPPRFWPNL